MANYIDQNCTLKVGDSYTSGWKKIVSADYWGRIKLRLISQNQATKKSVLSLSLEVSGDKNGSSAPSSNMYWRGNIKLGSTLLFNLGTGGKSEYKSNAGSKTVANLTNVSITIEHNALGHLDGGYVNTYIGYGYNSDGNYLSSPVNFNQVQIEDIPVYSEFSVSPDTPISVGSSVINYSIVPGEDSWSHEIGVALTQSSDPVITLSTVPVGTTTGTLLIPNDVADVMTSNVQTLYITCRAIKGSDRLGVSRVSRNFIIPNTAEFLPTMSINLSAVDVSGTDLIYGYVAGVSHVKSVASDITLKHGSTLSHIVTTIDSIDYYLQSVGSNYEMISDEPIKLSGTITITSKIVDSKGLVGTYNTQISVLPYSTPDIVSLSGYRSNSSGNVDVEGQYLHIELYYTITSILVNGSEYNGYMYKLGYKKTTDNTYNWVEDTTPSGTNIYTYSPMNVSRSVNVLVGDISGDYDVRFILYDKLRGTSGQASEDYVIRAAGNVFFNFRADGLGLGIGKLAELQGGIDLGWKLRMSSGIIYTELSANMSVNSIIVPGFYTGSTTNGNVDGPVPGDFGLIVKDISLGGTSIMQEFCSSDGDLYYRHYIYPNWSTWSKISSGSVLENYITANENGFAYGTPSSATPTNKLFEIGNAYKLVAQGGVQALGVTSYPPLDTTQTDIGEEVRTGGYWVDGKPLYRRVFRFTGPGPLFDLSSFNMESKLIVGVFANFKYNNANDYWANSYYWSNTTDRAQVYINNDSMILRLGDNITIYRGVWVVLDYTKTTD